MTLKRPQIHHPSPPVEGEEFDIPPSAVYMRALIFGYSGSGKSWFLSTVKDVPEMLPAAILSADGGSRTLWRRIGQSDEVKIFDTPSVTSLEKRLNQVASMGFATIMVDGMSAVYDRVLTFLAPPMSNYDTRVLPRTSEEWHNATQRDRGLTHEIILNMARWLAKQPSHVVVTCLADDLTDTEGRATGQIGILLAGKLRRRFPAEFDLVGYLDVDRVPTLKGGAPQAKRRLLLSPSRTVPELKTRYTEDLTVDLKDPDCAALLRHMRAEPIDIQPSSETTEQQQQEEIENASTSESD
jgi:muconolactone delta-isomerase